jgi:hypothetical protein
VTFGPSPALKLIEEEACRCSGEELKKWIKTTAVIQSRVTISYWHTSEDGQSLKANTRGTREKAK